MTTEERLTLIAQEASVFEPWTGAFKAEDLLSWYERELSTTGLLLPRTIVHIISGNTPHAAWQTLLNGLMLGAKNFLKLPSQGLEGFEKEIPSSLRPFIETARVLPKDWIPQADAMVVYGSDATIRHFRDLAPLEIPFVGHGHRVGVALIDDPGEKAAELAAKDIGDFDQQGCLSLQTIYLEDPKTFAPLLAKALAKLPPRGPMSLSDHGAILNLKQEIEYLSAQEPANYALWQGDDFLIVYEAGEAMSLSPGNRVVFLKKRSDFKPSRFLSGIALYPFVERNDLPTPRIFPLGKAQTPPFAWAHDGVLPLASLVRHQTCC